MNKTEVINSGKYKFTVTTNVQLYEDRITCHTYKLGGEYADCVNISYKYKNNKPVKAMIPHLLYEPECAVASLLTKGSGTELMIKRAILYAYNDVPSVPIFEFEDDSNIDCVEKQMGKPPPRKTVKPVNLEFFNIAYHGKTWYESRFNAQMIDSEKYKRYKKSLEFLTDPAKKPEFKNFLEIIENKHAADSPQLRLLEDCYRAPTYRKFFEAIPREARCSILYEWLETFMKHYIIYDNNWYIDARNMEAVQSGGSREKFYIFSYKKTSNF